MSILLTAATQFELKPLIDKGSTTSTGSNSFKLVVPGFPDIEILIAGVGTAATVFHLTEMLMKKKFDLAIQVGICGAFDPSLSKGEVVLVQSDCFAQLGAEDGDDFIDVFDLGLTAHNEKPFVDGKLWCTDKLSGNFQTLRKVSGSTSETGGGNEQNIEKIRNRLHPQTESMEGAGFYYVCVKLNTPAIQIRSVSNYVERRNKANWNIPLAVEQLNTFLIQSLPSIHT